MQDKTQYRAVQCETGLKQQYKFKYRAIQYKTNTEPNSAVQIQIQSAAMRDSLKWHSIQIQSAATRDNTIQGRTPQQSQIAVNTSTEQHDAIQNQKTERYCRGLTPVSSQAPRSRSLTPHPRPPAPSGMGRRVRKEGRTRGLREEQFNNSSTI